MTSFLDKIDRFYGTGEKNAAGQTLEEFLEAYDPHRYERPSCTTDAVILSHPDKITKDLDGFRVLLVKRSNHPSIGYWALPGGFAEMKEDLDDTARRELEEETGVTGIAMEQLATYGAYDRDPRSRVITTAYMALVKETEVRVRAGDDAADAVWCDVELETLYKGAEQVNGRLYRKAVYRLAIRNQSRRLDTAVLAERMWTDGLIREEHFHVTEQGMTAVDHGAILIQALVTLQERIAGKNV